MTESDWSDQSAGSGTGKGKDKATANWGAWHGGRAGPWWESRGGGQGRGGKWRKPGTMAFLKNHRKMLTHMAWSGTIELEQAESAYLQACRDFGEAKTQETTTRVRKAVEWVRDRSQNMETIAHKWRRLDVEHLYILTGHGEVLPLTEREKQLNITIRQELATASVAIAPPPPSSPAPPPKGSPPHRHQELGEVTVPPWRQVTHAMPEPPPPKAKPLPNSRSRSRSPVAPWRQVTHAMPEPPPPKAKPLHNRVAKRRLLARGSRWSVREGAGPPWEREKNEKRSKEPEEGHRAKRAASAAPAARDRLTGTTSKAGSACPPPPKPVREVPHFILQAHEVRPGDELDTDWTLHVDWVEEQRLRDLRNELIRAQILDEKKNSGLPPVGLVIISQGSL
jgi:hypothetical protein